MTTEANQLTPEQIKTIRNSRITFTEWQVADKTFYALLAVVGLFILAAPLCHWYE